jgi:hypothetical protein
LSRKGIPNRTNDAKAFVKRVEAMLKKAGVAENLERLACRFLTNEEDTKTGFGVWRTLMNYKFGMPTQPIEGNLTVSYTEALQKMRAKRGE